MRRSLYDVVHLPAIVVDALIALAIAVPAIVQWQFGLSTLPYYVSYTMLLIAPLVLRRVFPVLSFAIVALLCLLQLRLVWGPIWGDLALLVSVSSIARYGPSWARWGGLLVGLIGSVIGPLHWVGGIDNLDQRRDLYPMLAAALAVVTCWVLGDLSRTRARYVAGLEERNRRLAVERDQQAAIAAAEERRRIAREMHDVVAHTLSVIVVQADGGRFAAERDPDAAKRTLDTIARSARSALGEMRRLLGLLREDDTAEGMAPQPGVGDVAALVASVQDSGLPVSLDIVGEPREVDGGTALTVYRVIQEGLTNTMKHGGASARVTVRLSYGADQLTVYIGDDGTGPERWPGRDGSGQGLRGMRERIELHGGTMHVRARPGGGFELTATMPLVPVAVP